MEYEHRKYKAWCCAGCENIAFEIVYSSSPVVYDNSDYEYSLFFPKRGNRKRKFFIGMEYQVEYMYEEVIGCYNNDLLMLCSVGIRSLMEAIFKSEGISDNDFWKLEDKIKKYCSSHNLSEDFSRALLGVKLIGDKAIHQLSKTDKLYLSVTLDLMEAIFNSKYQANYDLIEKSEIAGRRMMKLVAEHENKPRKAGAKKQQE